MFNCFSVENKQRMETTSNAIEVDASNNASKEVVPLLEDVVLSWTLKDVLNENLYKDKVSFIIFIKCTFYIVFPNKNKHLDVISFKYCPTLICCLKVEPSRMFHHFHLLFVYLFMDSMFNYATIACSNF